LRAGRPHRTIDADIHRSMKIRVLGCSGSIAAGSRTTAFLVDHDLLVDAGTGVGDLKLEEMAQVDDIVVSHSHLDHVLAIGLLADSVLRLRMAKGRPPIRVHALPETIAALRAHVFNGVLWPDFTRLPTADQPVLQFVPFSLGDRLDIGGRDVEVLSAVHTVPAVGFAIHRPEGAWVYTGDTAPNPALWERLRQVPVAQLVIETAFGDDERQLARISNHLCPAALKKELVQLEGSVEVLITHIKPGEVDAVMTEIAAHASPHRIRALVAGDVLELR
jgi:ribonuclease BN (tRNA processing enzyme)